MKSWPLLLVLLLLAGCGSANRAATATGGAEKQPLTVGFSQIGAESGWRTAETESIRGEAARRGITLKFSDAQQKQENQIKALRTFVAQGVDAIILAPIVETGWEPVLKECKRAGIPVVLVDRKVEVTDDSLYVTLIASDFVKEGEMVGKWLAEKLGGKGSIIELQGTTGSAPANDRKQGFEAALAEFPDMKIVKSQSGDFSTDKGKQVTKSLLKAAQGEGLKIDAVYAHNDDMALGAIQAIEEEGLKPGTDVIVVSIDGVKGAFEAMVAGKLNCSVECNPLLGPAAFDAIEKIKHGEPVPKTSIVEDKLFDQQSAKAAIGTRQY